MTNDLVERLREIVNDDHIRGCQGREYSCGGGYHGICDYDSRKDALCVEAAEAIERLTKERDLALKALDNIVNHSMFSSKDKIVEYASAALEESK
jgi:hypothetical protein